LGGEEGEPNLSEYFYCNTTTIWLAKFTIINGLVATEYKVVFQKKS